MSKSSTATASKNPTQLPSKSAWSKGPPQSSSTAPSPRSQSPAPNNGSAPFHQTHSRRASNLGQGVPIKDGVSVPRSNIGAVKQGPAVTFGSINDVPAPISSSPAATPALKSEGVKAFGTLSATTPPTHVNGKSSILPSMSSKPSLTPSTSTSTASTPPLATPSTTSKPMGKMDILKLFQGSPSNTPSHPSSDTSSPSFRPSNLPSQQQQQPQHQPPAPPLSTPLTGNPYNTFVPGMRPQQQNGPGNGPGPTPRSPGYPRQMTNGNGPRSSGGPNGPNGGPPPLSAGLSSPRLAPHPHPGQPSGLPPQSLSVSSWQAYYPYPGLPVDPQHYMPSYSQHHFYYPQQTLQHQHQQQHLQHQHHPPPGPPHSSMTMSPRNPPPPLPPGTPTQPHAVLNSPSHPPPSHAGSNSISGLSSPPPTPSSVPISIPRLNPNTIPFVPRPSKVTIKDPAGQELNLDNLKKHGSPVVAADASGGFTPPNANRKSMVRIESEDMKRIRLAEEEEKERVKVEKEEKEKRAKAEKERLEREEEERKQREEEEKEKERVRKEEEEKERIRKEEEERLLKEEEERERVQLEQERMQREEKERQRQAEEEEKERIKKVEEEKERLRQEEEEKERLRLEEEERTKAAAAAAAIAAEEAQKAEEEQQKEPEDGELEDNVDALEEPVEASEESQDKLRGALKEKPKETLRIDTAAASPPLEIPRKRPGRLDLTATKGNVVPPLQSALATARNIDDLDRVVYPDGVMSPKIELNVNAKDGRFRYDRDFLLQFMEICQEKPDMLPPLDAIGLGPSDQSHSLSRGGSGRHRQASGASSASSSRAPPVGLGFSTGSNTGKPGAPNSFSMGNFATKSEERFANSSRVASVSGGQPGLPFGRPPPPMVRSSSQGGPGPTPMGSGRLRSKRGEKRGPPNDGSKPGPGNQQQGHGSSFNSNGPSGPMGSMFEPVAPLSQSQDRWVPVSTSRKPQAVDSDAPEIVDRKVKGLLNKLTMEKFDSISDQIIAWANKSEKEKDGRTLIQVIRLVFEKATDEATWSEMYARLCRKMMEQISAQVQDDGIKNAEGKPIAGGQLFRKYLLNRCQEDFERGWVAKEATAAAAATKAKEDQATKAAIEKSKGGETGDEVALYSDEYYAAQKAKRQGLGLIKFIGELFKLQMLTERIMHECVKKLIGNVENPEEEEIESLCKLLATVGSILDTNKARAHMDVYFSRMKELTKSHNVSSRMQFMLQDVIELRERKWISRNLVAAPTTIAQIHEAAAKEKAAQDKESYQRQMSMSRGGSRRGGDRGDYGQPPVDGWAVAGSGPPRAPPKAGDLSNFGKINKTAPMTFGPSSVFSNKKDTTKREPISRTNSSSNMFSMLSQNSESLPAVDPTAQSNSRGPSRKASVDLTNSGVPEAPSQRRKLVLAPRSKPVEQATPTVEPDSPLEDELQVEGMSETEAQKKIDEDSKEFFAVRNLDEAEMYFSNLPVEHRFRLVEKLVSAAVESKETDAQLVADLFSRAVAKDLCPPASFEEGFSPIAESLDDVAIDAPKAPVLMALMMKGACLDKDEDRRADSREVDGQ